MSLRDYLPDVDVRGTLRGGGRTTAQVASVTAYVVLLGVLIMLAFTAGSVFVAALATFVLFFALQAALPADRIDDAIRLLMSGEAGVRAWEWTLEKLARVREALPR